METKDWRIKGIYKICILVSSGRHPKGNKKHKSEVPMREQSIDIKSESSEKESSSENN